MARNLWTALTNPANVTGLVEYRVANDGLVRFRGTWTLTTAGIKSLALPAEIVPVEPPVRVDYSTLAADANIEATATTLSFGLNKTAGSTVPMAPAVWMAAPIATAGGSLVTLPGHAEIRNVLTGAWTPFNLGPARFGGLGVPRPKTDGDVDLGHDRGSRLGHDRPGVRTVTIPYVICQDTADLAGQKFVELVDLWESNDSGVDEGLWLREWGMGKMHLLGKPRGLTEDLTLIKSGVVRALATFECGDPQITYL